MANVKFVLDADEAKAVNAFLRVVDSQKKVERQFDRVKKKTKKQGKAFESLGKKAAVALGALAIPAAVFTVMTQYKQVVDSVIARMDVLAKGRSINLSVSADPKITRAQEEYYAKTAAVDQKEAHGAVFQIRSLFGSEKEKAVAVRVIARAAPFVLDSISLASGIGKWHENFKGEGATLEQIQAMIITGASASETDPSMFGAEYAKVMSNIKAVGGRSQFGASALAYGSKMKGSTSMAADRLKALTTDMQKLGVPGETMHDKFINMQKKGVTAANYLKTATGSTEAQEGFDIIESKYSEIINHASTIQKAKQLAGTPQGVVAEMRSKRDADALLYLPFLKKQGQVSEEIGLEKSPAVLQGQCIEAAVSQAKAAIVEKKGWLGIDDKWAMDLWTQGARHAPVGAVKPSNVGAVVYRLGMANNASKDGLMGALMGVHDVSPPGVQSNAVSSELPEKLLTVLESIDNLLKPPASQKKMNPNVHGE